jgi:HK97 family phage major capsid protein
MADGALFCRLANTNGGLVATQNPNGTVNASYRGYAIRFSSRSPDVNTSLAGQPMVYFGDLSMLSMIVETRPLTIALSMQHALDTDQFLVRGTARLDILNHSTGTATVKAPIGMLVGSS